MTDRDRALKALHDNPLYQAVMNVARTDEERQTLKGIAEKVLLEMVGVSTQAFSQNSGSLPPP